MADTPAFKKLQEDFLGDVFGVEPCDSIRRIPEGAAGDFQVKDFIDADIGIYQRLLKDGIPQTSNHPDGLNAHADFLKHATGRILISGLGLGESLNEALKKPDVTFVRIVEKEQDIIDLVAPSFRNNKRVEIIKGDILDYTTDEHFDIIYHAIWNDPKSARTVAAVNDRRTLRDRFDPICEWQGFIFISSRGGARPGSGTASSGRPIIPEGKKRTVKKGIRYTPGEYALIERASKLSKRSPSDLAVTGAVKEALEILGVEKSEHDAFIKKMAG